MTSLADPAELLAETVEAAELALADEMLVMPSSMPWRIRVLKNH